MVGRLKFKTGITLIELLIVVALMGAVNVAIYSVFSLGLKVWEQRQRASTEQDLAIFFEHFTRDLNRTFYHSMIDLEGGMHHVSFPTVLQVPPDSRGLPSVREAVPQIGQVVYSYDSARKRLLRKQARYASVQQQKYDSIQIMAQGIESFQIQYVYIVDNGVEIVERLLDTFPANIIVKVVFSEAQGRRQMTKKIDIPLSF
jgi:hypothetical protein